MTTRGSVVAVCLSAEGGVPKQPRAEVNVGRRGVVCTVLTPGRLRPGDTVEIDG